MFGAIRHPPQALLSCKGENDRWHESSLTWDCCRCFAY